MSCLWGATPILGRKRTTLLQPKSPNFSYFSKRLSNQKRKHSNKIINKPPFRDHDQQSSQAKGNKMYHTNISCYKYYIVYKNIR